MTEKKPSAKQPREVLDPEWEDSLRRGQEEEGERGSVEPELAMIHLLRHARAPEALSDQELDNLWADIEAEVAPAGIAWWRKAWVWWTAPVLATAAVVAVIVIQPGANEDAAVARQDQAAPQRAAGATLEESERKAEEAEDAEDAEAPGSIGGRDRAASSATAMPEPAAAREEAPSDGMGGEGAGGIASRGATLNPYESSYIQLEPQGRAALVVAVDSSRDQLRDQLLATARGGGR